MADLVARLRRIPLVDLGRGPKPRSILGKTKQSGGVS
jgi:hypothetical protein